MLLRRFVLTAVCGIGLVGCGAGSETGSTVSHSTAVSHPTTVAPKDGRQVVVAAHKAIRAEFSYLPGKGMKIGGARLEIIQQGVGTVFDSWVDGKKDAVYLVDPGSTKQIQVLRLPGSTQPAVVLAQASGGNRCCVDLHIYQLDDKSGVFVETARTSSSEKPGSFDNRGFTVEKLTHGYVFQGVDKNGKLQVLRFTRRHKFRDVTRFYNLPTI